MALIRFTTGSGTLAYIFSYYQSDYFSFMTTLDLVLRCDTQLLWH